MAYADYDIDQIKWLIKRGTFKEFPLPQELAETVAEEQSIIRCHEVYAACVNNDRYERLWVADWYAERRDPFSTPKRG